MRTYAGTHILVAAQRQAIAEAISTQLGELGLSVVQIGNDADVQSAIAEADPALLVLDVALRDERGYDVCAELKAHPQTNHLPIVMLAGPGGNLDRRRATEAGAEACLTDPLDLIEVSTTIHALLRTKGQTDELRRANETLQEKVYLLTTLFAVANQLRDSLEPSEVYRIAKEILQSIVGAEVFTIFVREDDTTDFRLAASRNLPTPIPGQTILPLDQDIMLKVFATAEALPKPVFEESPSETTIRIADGIFPVAAVVPLLVQRQIEGLFIVHSFTAERGQPPDFELMTMLSTQVAAAIHSARLYQKIRKYTAELDTRSKELRSLRKTLEQQMYHLNTLSLFSSQLHRAVNLGDVYAAIGDLATNFIGAEQFTTIFYASDEPSVYRSRAEDGAQVSSHEDLPPPYWRLAEHVIDTGQPYIRGDGEEQRLGDASLPTDLELLPVACVPLLVENKPSGVLILENLLPQKDGLSSHDYELLSLLAQEAALAIYTGHLHRRVEMLAVTDGLTGTYNRRYLDERLGLEVRRAERYMKPLSLLMMDLDNLKEINDRYGHPCGDRALKELTAAVSHLLRDVDWVARYGGDEFVVVLPETDIAGGHVVAQRLGEAIQEHRILCGGGADHPEEIGISVSMGVSCYPQQEDAATILQAADQALYAAKTAGKGSIVVAP